MQEIFTKAVALAATISIPAVCVADGFYNGSAERYMAVTMTAEPDLYGDDDPWCDRYSVDLDIYIPLHENYRSWLSAFRYAMEGAGFDNVSFNGQITDSDSDKRHLMLNGMYNIYREDAEEE